MRDEPLRLTLLREYGAVIGGRDLRSILGFKSTAAFSRAVRSGHVHLEFLKVPGRRGRFALASNIADWLEALPKCGALDSRSMSAEPHREGAEM